MTLFLIAHKVRGARAFDIAEPMDMPDGRWWIIPTSGHRAYPYWFGQIDTHLALIEEKIGDPPQDLRDHYAASQHAASQHEPTRSFAAPKPEDL